MNAEARILEQAAARERAGIEEASRRLGESMRRAVSLEPWVAELPRESVASALITGLLAGWRAYSRDRLSDQHATETRSQ